jgi:hypothetical protein
MAELTWLVPIKTVSELNCTQNWIMKHKRHKRQKLFVTLILRDSIKRVSLPCQIKLTRIAPRKLDFDNLVASQKWVVDSVCDLLIPGLRAGRADGDERISVAYAQEVGPSQMVRIEITYN